MKILTLILRLLFGAVFLWSGIAKLKDPIGFADAVRNFQIVGDPIATALALFIPWVEIVCGIAAMIGLRFSREGIVVLLVSLLVFTAGIVAAWVRGLDISCGCFGGSDEAMNYPVKIMQNLVLGLIGIAALVMGRKRSQTD